jgi:hypothetical protein
MLNDDINALLEVPRRLGYPVLEQLSISTLPAGADMPGDCQLKKLPMTFCGPAKIHRRSRNSPFPESSTERLIRSVTNDFQGHRRLAARPGCRPDIGVPALPEALVQRSRPATGRDKSGIV